MRGVWSVTREGAAEGYEMVRFWDGLKAKRGDYGELKSTARVSISSGQPLGVPVWAQQKQI